MRNVQSPLEPSLFAAIPRIREIIKTLPHDTRRCPKHGEEVTIQERDFSTNPGVFAPFKKADWVGCCAESISHVVAAIQTTQCQIVRAKETYKNELAPQLEREHCGEIVAIELGTNEYFVGEDEIEAADKARAAGHEGSLFFLRVGSPYVYRLMTPRQ